jgi:short-subunit dehydrogenase
MAIYGAMKTAREAILRSLSREIQQDFPNLNMKVLNYAPGPMDTALVRNDLLGDDAPMNFVKSSSLSFVDEKESASKCINLITSPDLDFKWSSGDHIDFFDDL